MCAAAGCGGIWAGCDGQPHSGRLSQPLRNLSCITRRGRRCLPARQRCARGSQVRLPASVLSKPVLCKAPRCGPCAGHLQKTLCPQPSQAKRTFDRCWKRQAAVLFSITRQASYFQGHAYVTPHARKAETSVEQAVMEMCFSMVGRQRSGQSMYQGNTCVRRWHMKGGILNPASMKQALVEGAVRIPGINLYEQGAGKMNLLNSMVRATLPAQIESRTMQVPVNKIDTTEPLPLSPKATICTQASIHPFCFLLCDRYCSSLGAPPVIMCNAVQEHTSRHTPVESPTVCFCC